MPNSRTSRVKSSGLRQFENRILIPNRIVSTDLQEHSQVVVDQVSSLHKAFTEGSDIQC